MDGAFVPNISFGAPVIRALRPHTGIFFDAHLMIREPIRYLSDFVSAGCDLITVHAEADGDVMAAVKKIKDLGLRAGITINPPADVSMLDPYLDKVDMVLIMTVNAGFGGQKFHPECLPKIEAVRRWAEDHNPALDISVDGGINRETGKLCADAGANVLVAGSALFKLPDMTEEIALWKKFGRD